jgi:hypothetical protein
MGLCKNYSSKKKSWEKIDTKVSEISKTMSNQMLAWRKKREERDE